MSLFSRSLASLKAPALAAAARRPLVTMSPALQSGDSIVSSSQYDRGQIEQILQMSDYMHSARHSGNKLDKFLTGRVLGSMFFDDSAVTLASFHSAMQRLGGTVLEFDHASAKGQTVNDSVQTMSQLVDCIILRHSEADMAKAAELSSVPLINSSSLRDDHPTQALLDLFTITNELGVDSPDGLNITMVGDLAGERAAHSFVTMLSQFSGVTFNFVAPEAFQIPAEVAAVASEHQKLDHFNSVLATTDVMYFTQVAPDKFGSAAAYGEYQERYRLESGHMAGANPGMIVMHPLPRIDEISPDVDADPRAVYFRQAGYGLSTRMALLTLSCGSDSQIQEAKGLSADAARVIDRQPMRKRRAAPPMEVPNTEKYSGVDGTSKSGSRKNLSSRPMQGQSTHTL